MFVTDVSRMFSKETPRGLYDSDEACIEAYIDERITLDITKSVICNSYVDWIKSYLTRRVVCVINRLRGQLSLFDEFCSRWDNHKLLIECLGGQFLAFVNKFMSGKKPLQVIGLKLFGEVVLGNCHEEIISMVVEQIREERCGHNINRYKLKSAVDVFTCLFLLACCFLRCLPYVFVLYKKRCLFKWELKKRKQRVTKISAYTEPLRGPFWKIQRDFISKSVQTGLHKIALTTISLRFGFCLFF